MAPNSYTGVILPVIALLIISSEFTVVIHCSDGGHFAVSGAMYRSTVTFNSIPHQIVGYHYFKGDTVDGDVAALECTRACLRHPACSSFIHAPSQRRCLLSKIDRCANPKSLLVYREGFHTFEIKTGASFGNTCYDTCRFNHTCDDCGRPNCEGVLCDKCRATCWILEPLITKNTIFFIDLSTPVTITCSQEWQRVYTSQGLFVYRQVLASPLKLQVRVQFEGESTYRVAYFDSFSYSQGRVSVGAFTGGDAGNGLGAPFGYLPHIIPSGSNCAPFYYDASAPCHANGVTPYQDQVAQGITHIHRGYMWKTSDPVLANTKITYLHLYVTKI